MLTSLPRTPLACIVFGAIALLLVACGGDSEGSGGSDEQRIELLVESFFSQTFGGDPEKAYDKLSTEAKALCSEKDFVEQAELAKALFAALGGKGNFEVERVFDIRVTGDTASAKVDVTVDDEPSDDGPGEATFTRENGVWKLDEGC